MTYRSILTILTVAAMFVPFGACNDISDSVVNPIPDKNLLSNSSFELFGSPSIDNWRISSSDSTNFHFSTDTPPGGGKLSINLKNNWPNPPVTLTQFVPAPAGSHAYRFSIWAKDHNGISQASWGYRVSSLFVTVRSIAISDTGWKYYSAIDTITTTVADTLGVSIIGGYLQPADSGASTFFDLCKLEKLN